MALFHHPWPPPKVCAAEAVKGTATAVRDVAGLGLPDVDPLGRAVVHTVAGTTSPGC
jgi:hypothetical protein